MYPARGPCGIPWIFGVRIATEKCSPLLLSRANVEIRRVEKETGIGFVERKKRK